MPILAGWLEKKGHLVKNWKRRYVIVEENILIYYVDDSLNNKKGEMKLDETTRILIRDGKTHSWKFRIITRGKELELSALNEDERNLWVTTLKETLGIKCDLYRSSSLSISSSTTISTSLTTSTSTSGQSRINSIENDTLIFNNNNIYNNNKEEGEEDSDDEIIDEPIQLKQEFQKENHQYQEEQQTIELFPEFSLDILPDLDDLLGK